MSNLKVGYSPLSTRIYAGSVSKAGDSWLSNKTDVTSDVLKAIILKVGAGNTIVVESDGKPAYEIIVKEITDDV